MEKYPEHVRENLVPDAPSEPAVAAARFSRFWDLFLFLVMIAFYKTKQKNDWHSRATQIKNCKWKLTCKAAFVSGFVKSSRAFWISFSFLRSASAASSFSNLWVQKVAQLEAPHNDSFFLGKRLQSCEHCLIQYVFSAIHLYLPNGDQFIQ